MRPPWFDVPPDVPVRSWRSCESADSAGRSAPARLPLSIRRITFFVMNGPRCESSGTAPQPLSIMLCITCSGSRNVSASQRTPSHSCRIHLCERRLRQFRAEGINRGMRTLQQFSDGLQRCSQTCSSSFVGDGIPPRSEPGAERRVRVRPAPYRRSTGRKPVVSCELQVIRRYCSRRVSN